jgi:hypothetical protein
MILTIVIEKSLIFQRQLVIIVLNIFTNVTIEIRFLNSAQTPYLSIETYRLIPPFHSLLFSFSFCLSNHLPWISTFAIGL